MRKTVILLLLFFLFGALALFSLEPNLPNYLWKSKFKSSTMNPGIGRAQGFFNDDVFLLGRTLPRNTSTFMPLNVAVFTDNFRTLQKTDYSFWDSRNTWGIQGWVELDDRICLYARKHLTSTSVMPEVFHFSKDGVFLGKYIDSTHGTLPAPSRSAHFFDKKMDYNYIYFDNSNNSYNQVAFDEYGNVVRNIVLETELIDSNLDNFIFYYAMGTSDLGSILRFSNFVGSRNYTLLVKFDDKGKHLWTKKIEHPFGYFKDDVFWVVLQPSIEQGFFHYTYTAEVAVSDTDTIVNQKFYKIRESDGEIVHSRIHENVTKNGKVLGSKLFKTLFNGSVLVSVNAISVDYELDSTNNDYYAGKYDDIIFYDLEYNIIENYILPHSEYFVIDIVSSKNKKLLFVTKTYGEDYESYTYGEVRAGAVSVSEFEEYSAAKSLIYPNPASDILHIRTDEQIARAELCDLLGNVVKAHTSDGVETKNLGNVETKNFSSLQSINVEGLPAGMYFLKLYTMSGVVLVEKVVVRF
jgi:hypothetical protein